MNAEIRREITLDENGTEEGFLHTANGRIWYRISGKDKKGTGLGLSIVKEIITAHGETIDVTSTPGSGTEFIFRLPLAR